MTFAPKNDGTYELLKTDAEVLTHTFLRAKYDLKRLAMRLAVCEEEERAEEVIALLDALEGIRAKTQTLRVHG